MHATFGYEHYEPFDEYVKQVELKPFKDISAEVENEMIIDVMLVRLGQFTIMPKHRVWIDDEPAENDKASEIEECGPFQENFG